MNEKEKLNEELIKYMLNEMARKKSEIIASLHSEISTIFIHLILIMLYPNNREVNHWKGEIARKFVSFDMMKHNKRYPNFDDLKDYRESVYDKADKALVNYIKLAYRNEGYKIKDKLVNIKQIDLAKMSNLIKMFIDFICNNIDKDTGLVDIDLIYEELDNVIEAYNNN